LAGLGQAEVIPQQPAFGRQCLVHFIRLEGNVQPIAGGQKLGPAPAGDIGFEIGIGRLLGFQPDKIISGERGERQQSNRQPNRARHPGSEMRIHR
jgi:hypothetical protein